MIIYICAIHVHLFSCYTIQFCVIQHIICFVDGLTFNIYDTCHWRQVMSLNYINVFILFYVICSACSKLKNQMGHATAWLICHFKLIKRLNLVDSVYYQPIIFPSSFSKISLFYCWQISWLKGRVPMDPKSQSEPTTSFLVWHIWVVGKM